MFEIKLEMMRRKWIMDVEVGRDGYIVYEKKIDVGLSSTVGGNDFPVWGSEVIPCSWGWRGGTFC